MDVCVGMNESRMERKFFHFHAKQYKNAANETTAMVDWQVQKTSVHGRNSFMFNNSIMSDVTLIVGKGDEQVCIPAHKYVLSISSPVFYAMFFGLLADKSSSEIKIEDSDPDALYELLRYFYCDEVFLNTDNAFGTLYLAKKYVVPHLADQCVTFLEQHMDADNALEILPQATLLGEEKLEERCWDIIDCRTSQVLESSCFQDVSVDLLKSVLERDTLWAEEIDIFKALLNWAEKECRRCDLMPTHENLRTVTGTCLNLVRFPTMTEREFADHVAKSGLLKPEEALEIFLYFTSTTKPNLLFPTMSRLGPAMHHVRRFPAAHDGMRYGYYGTEEAIKFQTDHDVSIDGIGLYGALEGITEGRFEIIAQIIRDNQILKHMRFTSGPTDDEHIYEITFDDSIPVIRGVWYSIVVRLQGPRSWKGIDGNKVVNCHGVTFHFASYAVNSVTSETQGQIPDLLFHLV